MSDQITLSIETVNKLCPECKAVLVSSLGLADTSPSKEDETDSEDEQWEYAQLGLQAARAFLLGCNEKTKKALQLIVEAGDSFSLHDIEDHMQVERGSLRALWGGLTKRIRTITGDPDAALIEWGDQLDTGDYIGSLNPTTRDSFRRALAE